MNFVLEARKLGFIPIDLYAHPGCSVSTPFDMMTNQIIEDARGDARHGSCGVGIWETILRDGLTYQEMIDLYFADDKHTQFRNYLTFVREYFLKRISDKGIKLDKDWNDVFNDDRIIDNYIADFHIMHSYLHLSTTVPLRDMIIFENGQGLLLDQNVFGYGKNTTPSNTGLQNPAKLIKEIEDEKDVEVCYVSRTYMTRHGAGRFDSEWEGLYFNDITNQPHPYQGSLRFGILDNQDMIDRCQRDFNNYAESDWKISFMLTHTNEVKPEEHLYLGYRLYLSGSPERESIHLVGE